MASPTAGTASQPSNGMLMLLRHSPLGAVGGSREKRGTRRLLSARTTGGLQRTTVPKIHADNANQITSFTYGPSNTADQLRSATQ